VVRIRTTTETVHKAGDGTCPDDVVATLLPVAQQIGEASAGVAVARSTVDDAKSATEAALKGGKPKPLQDLQENIKQALGGVVVALADARHETEATIATAQQLGDASAGIAGDAGQSSPDTGTASRLLARSGEATRNARQRKRQRRDADVGDDTAPTPRRERVSAEAIGFWAATGAAAWATVAEFMPVAPKAVAGTLLATAAAISAGKSWMAKRRKHGDDNEG
jgi:hypothetical protein